MPIFQTDARTEGLFLIIADSSFVENILGCNGEKWINFVRDNLVCSVSGDGWMRKGVSRSFEIEGFPFNDWSCTCRKEVYISLLL